jgi:micrococcal nuclease
LNPNYTYKALVYKVYDGDTFKAEVDLGFNVKIRETFRLYGVDTPEMRGNDKIRGKEVRDKVRNLILDKEITLRSIKNKGKYGRWLGQVTIPEGDLAEILVADGDAKTYFGGKR